MFPLVVGLSVLLPQGLAGLLFSLAEIGPVASPKSGGFVEVYLCTISESTLFVFRYPVSQKGRKHIPRRLGSLWPG